MLDGDELAQSGSKDDLRVDQNTRFGIFTTGQGAIVRRNQIADTGGADNGRSVFGIRADGNGSLIEDNVVAGLTATGTGSEFGIVVFAVGALVRENFITDAAKPPIGGGLSLGITLTFAFNNVLDNTVSNMGTCIAYNAGSTGLFVGNTVTGCDTNFFCGTAGHGNNPEPEPEETRCQFPPTILGNNPEVFPQIVPGFQ